jgi:aminoglycoside N3'-acetyltransferase
MAPDTRENGSLTNSMVKEKKVGQIKPPMRASTSWGKNTGRVCSSGLMGLSMRANSLTIS